MLYTVKEVSTLSNVTIKTLHHYHKIGLLLPSEISEAGYRLYGTKELERLQEILLYRELDFPLEQIKQLLEGAPERLSILSQQEELLVLRKQRLETIIQTLGKSISCTKKGETMDNKEMFRGFESDTEWNEALKEQNQYLKETYQVEAFEVKEVEVEDINEQAAEAVAFMNEIASSLKAGLRHDNEKIANLIRDHLIFLNEHGHVVSAMDFAAQNKFFLRDDFHLSMLEGQQTGLAYYLAAAAEAYAIEHK